MVATTEKFSNEPTVVKKKMAPSFALFNSHINDAYKRALQEMRDMGWEQAEKEILAIENEHNGIMAILDVKMTPAIGVFLG